MNETTDQTQICPPIWVSTPEELSAVAVWRATYFLDQTESLPEAVSNQIDAKWLKVAYAHGLFPWYNEDEPVYWWSPNPRMILFPNEFKLHLSLKKTIKKRFSGLEGNHWETRINTSFERVMRECAQPRQVGGGTWINDNLISAYLDLHQQGLAHSFETWRNNELVGGLYCVAINRLIFGESMFTRVSDASKMALHYLVNWCLEQDIIAIDCQQQTQHLQSLGARPISKKDWMTLIKLRSNTKKVRIKTF